MQNLRKSLVRNWEPVCSLVRDAVSGAICPFPLPSASCLQRGWASPQLASSSLGSLSSSFVWERAEVCSDDWLIFSLSLAIPQFKLLSHISSLQSPSGHSGPVLTLSNAARSSLFHPHLLVANVSVWGYFSAGSFF